MGEIGDVAEGLVNDKQLDNSLTELQALLAEGKFDQDRFSKLKGYMDNPQETKQKIKADIVELAKRSKTPDTVQNPRVKKAYDVLRKFFTEQGDVIGRLKGNVIVYGSMQYDDPRNLDFDILIQVADEMYDLPEARKLGFSLNDKLLEIWESNKVGIDGHIVFESKGGLQKALLAIDQGDEGMITLMPNVFYNPVSEISKLVTGVPFLVTDPDGLVAMKSASLSAIDRYPLVGAFVRDSLEDTVSRRREREATVVVEEVL